MFFKKNEKKAELKRAIKAKRQEIINRKREDKIWIDRMMRETDPELGRACAIIIKCRANDTAMIEDELRIMEKWYRAM